VTARVIQADPMPSGLAEMLGGLIAQNLERDPGRERLLHPALVGIEAPDAGVAVTLRIDPGRVLIDGGIDAGVQLRVSADSDRLLGLIAAPLRLGLPDVFTAEGREVLVDVLARRVRIGGMISHLRRLARLTMLLSVR
jgi:hypothetical protein